MEADQEQHKKEEQTEQKQDKTYIKTNKKWKDLNID